MEYDISFACFENAGENGEDIPIAIVCHNAKNPNFEIDIIDMRGNSGKFDEHITYKLSDGVCVASGSPYGCEQGDAWQQGAGSEPITKPYNSPQNPEILQNAVGLSISGLSMYKNYVALAYRSQGLPHLAVMSKKRAVEDFCKQNRGVFAKCDRFLPSLRINLRINFLLNLRIKRKPNHVLRSQIFHKKKSTIIAY